jgi:hypothetical protein
MATDQAGNVGSGSTSFSVTVTFDSLENLTKGFSSKQGTSDSLVAKLEAAKAAGDRGNAQAKTGLLNAFVNEVSAQSGKAFTAEEAEILIQLAQHL